MSEFFYQNKECPYYPCHDIPDGKLNCMWCYCPLYCLPNCGGDYTILSSGIKDCSNCKRSHTEDFIDIVRDRFGDIVGVFCKAYNDSVKDENL